MPGRLGGSDDVALMAIALGIDVPIANALAICIRARLGEADVFGARLRDPLSINVAC